MRQKRFYRVGAILLTALLLIASVVPTCFAAGSVGEVNLHIGQSADTVYLTYTSSDKAAAPVTVTGPLGTSTYPAQSVWSDSAGKYIHQAALTGLTAGTDYTYTLENGAYSSGFTYMLRYDGKADRMTIAPYLYDSLILHRGAALWADEAALEKLPPSSWDAELADIPMTRGAVVTELYRMAGSPSGVKPAAFPDVPAGTELARAVSWAAGEGIVSGLPDGSFAPEQSVTRAQFAVFAQRYVNAMGKQAPDGGGVGTYRDWRQVPAWAEPALGWAVQVGLFRGRSRNLLAPNDGMNRAEGAVCFQRLQYLSQ